MRLLLVPFLLAAGVFVARAADNPSLTGKWQVHTSAAGYENDYACAFTQKDNDLAGSCVPDEGNGSNQRESRREVDHLELQRTIRNHFVQRYS